MAAEWPRLRGDLRQRADGAAGLLEELGAPSEVELPSDAVRPLERSFRGAHQPWQLSRELLNEVKELGRGEGATLFMTLLAAFMGLVHFYTGKDDLVVGEQKAKRRADGD